MVRTGARYGLADDVPRTDTSLGAPIDGQVPHLRPAARIGTHAGDYGHIVAAMNPRICLALAAAAMCTAVPACSASSPVPNPRDVQACQDVKKDLAATNQDPLSYDEDEAIASTKLLQKAIGSIGSAIALRPAVGYGEENEAITIMAKLCSQDGVQGVSG